VDPNENYAREVLQLFSIGLEQLNQDGTPQLDGSGNPIPTYDQDTIEGFAHTFTGWTYPTKPGATARFRNPEYYGGPMYAATLANWFGVPTADLPTIFPNLANFTTPTLNFLG
jgi:hypothetical protein